MCRARLRSRFRSPLFARTAGGGDRTHTILRSLDFESSASASSATPARRDQATKEKRKLKRQQMSSLLSERSHLMSYFIDSRSLFLFLAGLVCDVLRLVDSGEN